MVESEEDARTPADCDQRALERLSPQRRTGPARGHSAHDRAVRGNRWELALPKPFLKPGAFHLQQTQPISLAHFDARLGVLTREDFKHAKATLVRLLNL
jgi:hypothetical protein